MNCNDGFEHPERVGEQDKKGILFEVNLMVTETSSNKGCEFTGGSCSWIFDLSWCAFFGGLEETDNKFTKFL